MANEEHVERLKRSRQEWNEWRRQQPEIRPDLSHADLSRTNLSYINLARANLRYTNLNGVYLYETDLTNADLGESNLYGTNFISAHLKGADFTHTHFWDTAFARVDLSCVTSLNTVIHHGPSTINLNSVLLPPDELTCLHFLRGVGFTETQIEYLPSLLTPRPIEYSSLFISYAHQDETIAKRLHGDLRKQDVPCWFAPHDMKIGDEIRSRIDEAIRLHDKLLLILSEHSVASQWVKYEVKTALGKEQGGKPDVLFPVCLDDAVLKSSTGWASDIRLTRHIGDFTNWQDDAAYQEAFSRLLRDLKISKPSTG